MLRARDRIASPIDYEHEQHFIEHEHGSGKEMQVKLMNPYESSDIQPNEEPTVVMANREQGPPDQSVSLQLRFDRRLRTSDGPLSVGPRRRAPTLSFWSLP